MKLSELQVGDSLGSKSRPELEAECRYDGCHYENLKVTEKRVSAKGRIYIMIRGDFISDNGDITHNACFRLMNVPEKDRELPEKLG